jgi:hypothetical protein
MTTFILYIKAQGEDEGDLAVNAGLIETIFFRDYIY